MVTRRRALCFIAVSLASPAEAQQTPAARLLGAAARGDSHGVAEALDAGAPVDARDSGGRTALLLTTHGDHPEVAKLLIRRGADVNAKDGIEDSPFLFAGAEGRTDILRLTLGAGADLRATNRYGGTALIPAAHHGHVEAVRVLVGTAIDVNHVNKLGWTALLEAVILGNGGSAHTEIVRLLLDGGAKPDLADREGVTPLAHAKRRGQTAIVQLLAGAGAH